MLDVLHFSSRPMFKSAAAKGTKFGALALILLGTSLLGGCSQTTGSNSAPGLFSGLKKPAAVSAPNQASSENAVAKTSVKPVDQIAVGTVQQKISDPKASNVTALELENNSAWCRYLKANSSAEAEIIASPTLSGSSDDQGNGSLNIGMNLLDFKKAELVRQSGDAKCQAHTAGKLIEATLQLSDEATKYAAANAKFQYLASRKGAMNAIVNKARALTSQGVLTVQQANAISASASSLMASANQAKSESDKRRDLPSIDQYDIAGRNAALIQAHSQLQAIDREIRTVEAFDISVQAGYRINQGETAIADTNDYYAKIKVGVRLGALGAKRRHYEDAAETARIDALTEENSGSIWKSDFAANAIGKSISALKSARQDVASSYSSSGNSASQLQNSDRPELIFAAMQAQMQQIAYGADLASLDASIIALNASKSRLTSLAK